MLHRKGRPDEPADWQRVPAEVVTTRSGFIHERGAGLGPGGGYATTASDTTYVLELRPASGAPYEAKLEISWKVPAAERPPMVTGTRFEVLVDRTDPHHLALPPDATYTLPDGREYAPSGDAMAALRAAAHRGDSAEVARLTAELRARSAANAGPFAPPAAGPATNPRLERLEALGRLRSSGVLDDEEFEAEKARILHE